jgi:hypothetical protein
MIAVSRRGLIRAASAAAPLGLIGPRDFGGNRLALSDLASPPICKSAASVPVTVVPNKRALKLTWAASAICTVDVPVAAQKGYFAKRNLDVELINFGGSTDQLRRARGLTSTTSATVSISTAKPCPSSTALPCTSNRANSSPCSVLPAAASPRCCAWSPGWRCQRTASSRRTVRR